MMGTPATLLAFALAFALLGGCASAPTASEPEPDRTIASFTIESASYNETFQRTKDALREFDFTLDRVDARAGVITTRSAPSAGLATPWIDHAQTADDAVRGFLNREQRLARVTFTPTPDDDPRDLRAYEGSLDVRVEVTIYRVHEPARRHEATSILLTSRSGGRRAGETIATEPRVVPVGTDEPLSSAIRRFIETD